MTVSRWWIERDWIGLDGIGFVKGSSIVCVLSSEYALQQVLPPEAPLPRPLSLISLAVRFRPIALRCPRPSCVSAEFWVRPVAPERRDDILENVRKSFLRFAASHVPQQYVPLCCCCC